MKMRKKISGNFLRTKNCGLSAKINKPSQSKNLSKKIFFKGEAVCLDRCLAKYLDVHDRLGKLLMQMTQQDDKAQQQQQQSLAATAQKMHGK